MPHVLRELFPTGGSVYYNPGHSSLHICRLARTESGSGLGRYCWNPTEVGLAQPSSPAATQWEPLAAEVTFLLQFLCSSIPHWILSLEEAKPDKRAVPG